MTKNMYNVVDAVEAFTEAEVSAIDKRIFDSAIDSKEFGKWKVLVRPSDYNSDKLSVTFVDMSQDKEKFPLGQITPGTYYLDTLLGLDGDGSIKDMPTLVLDYDIPSWTVEKEELDSIYEWLLQFAPTTEKVEESADFDIRDDVIAAVEDGFLDWETVAMAFLKAISPDKVKDIVEANGWALAGEEESYEDVVGFDKERELLRLHGELDESEESDKVKDYYINMFPDDELGAEINPELTFDQVYTALENGEEIYDVLGVGDSIVRERVFAELARRRNVDYDVIYYLWLDN